MIMNEMIRNMNDERDDFLSDFKHFRQFFERDRPTKRLTNRPTDAASYSKEVHGAPKNQLNEAVMLV